MVVSFATNVNCTSCKKEEDNISMSNLNTKFNFISHISRLTFVSAVESYILNNHSKLCCRLLNIKNRLSQLLLDQSHYGDVL